MPTNNKLKIYKVNSLPGTLTASTVYFVKSATAGLFDIYLSDSTGTTAYAIATAAKVPNGAITLAMMANMATASLIYRRSAGTGVPEVNTLAQLKTDLTLVKGDVGLGSIDNTSDINKPVSTLQAAADTAVLNTAKGYADSLVVGLWDDRGNFNASVNTYPTTGGSGTSGAILKGDTWTINVVATSGPLLGLPIGSTVRCLADTPGQTAANWDALEVGLGYVPENAANRNATGGYVGLSGFNHILTNVAGTIQSFFTTTATVARTWTLPDKDGTIAMISDITGTNSGINTGDQTITLNGEATGTGTSAISVTLNNASVIGKVLTGLSTIAGTVFATDSILAAIGKLTGNISTEITNRSTADGLLVPKTTTVNGHALSGNVAVTAADLSLGNVDNTSDVNKPVSTLQAAADTAALNSAKAYADSLVVGLWDDRGNFNASVNTYPTTGGSGTAGAILKGDTYTISVVATSGALLGYPIGSTVRCLADTPGQTAANWDVLDIGLGYVAENQANKNATGGYAGLSGFNLILKNVAGTINSVFTTAATVARTWTLPDKDGTIAMISDITSAASRYWAGNIASLTSNSTIAVGTSAPSSASGTQLFTQTITPQTTANKYSINVSVNLDGSANQTITIALFRGTTYLAAAFQLDASATTAKTASIQFIDAPATTSPITYTLMVGSTSGAWYVNRRSTENSFGGTNSGWKIEEKVS